MTSVEYAYNPDQPRVPAGAPEGGQWVTNGSEKQNAWANKIVDGWARKIQGEIDNLNERIQAGGTHPKISLYKKELEEAKARFLGEVTKWRASDVIDRRDSHDLGRAIIDATRKKIIDAT